MEAAPRRPRAKMEEAKMRRHQEGGGPNLESTLHRSSVAVTFTFKGSQRCAGARSHEFVVAIAFAQPPSTLPRDPNIIPRDPDPRATPHNRFTERSLQFTALVLALVRCAGAQVRRYRYRYRVRPRGPPDTGVTVVLPSVGGGPGELPPCARETFACDRGSTA